MLLAGKVAIVTGAANGLGRATARRVVEEGGHVVLGDIDVDGVGEVAAALGDAARPIALDVANDEQWGLAVATAKREFGGFHILVNNAAVSCMGSVEDVSFEEWRRVVTVNAGGAFLGCKHAMRSMTTDGGGVIINVSSNSTIGGIADVPVYSSAKATMNTLTRSIAARCIRDGLPIRCNTVVPGGMVSKMARDAFLDFAGVDIAQPTPEARSLLTAMNVVDPVEVADVIVAVASDLMRRVNGAEILADGGDTSMMARAG